MESCGVHEERLQVIQNLLLDPSQHVKRSPVKQYTGEAASQALLCQPSSAAAERVFNSE